MFSPSNELLLVINTDCSLVKMTLYCLNPYIALNFCAAVVLQSMNTFTNSSLSIKLLLSYFFCSSSSSNVCFLWSEI